MSPYQVFRFKVGDFNCLAVNDGDTSEEADVLFSNAPAAELKKALERHNLTTDRLPSTWTCLLIDTGNQLVLVDTGLGILEEPDSGQLAPALASEGYTSDQVDYVILTHGHGDHIGGAIDENDRPRFANARYIMWHTELEYLTSEDALAELPDWMSEPARRIFPPLANQMEALYEETEIVPGITVLPAPGHTIGHVAVEIASHGSKLLNIADAALHPIHLEHPEWVATVSQNPEATVDTRRALFARAAADRSLVLGFHFWPFPSLGTIESAGGGWRWVEFSAQD